MRPPESRGFGQTLREFQALLNAVAQGHTPDRADAMAYTRLRDELVKGGSDAPIPGFVHQCLSIASFKTFIGLYHSSKEARQRFIEESFARSNRMFDRRPLRSVPRSSDGF
jgi:hypothetical protein